MKDYKKTANQEKILEGLQKAYENLIESKKKTNTEIAIIKDNKIVRIKP